MSLVGQRIVIIGGSSGMGRATAHAASAKGAAVTIASSDPVKLEAVRATLPDTCDAVVADVRNEDDITGLFEHVGELDHLVVTAGDAVVQQPFAAFGLAEARRLFDVRFWGVVAAVKHAAPRLRADGSIVLTSGTAAVRPTPGVALIASAAAAIEGLTRGLAVELAPLRVNAVRPGSVRTPLWDAIPDEQRDDLFAALTERALTGNVGEADEIAEAHLYLMENGFMTGTVLTIDGGSILT